MFAAAVAKSLQSCPTLCDPIDGSPLGSSEKVGLKLNIQKTKIMASSPIISWEIYGEKVESIRVYFGGLQNHCRW